MHQYITELSKYALTGCMAIYILLGFLGLSRRREDSRGLYAGQCACIFLIQFLCYLNLTVVSGKMEYVYFYAFAQIFLLAVAVMVPLIYETANRQLLSGSCMLMGIGLCMIARLSFGRAVRQYIILLLSLMIGLLIPDLFSRIRFFKKLTWAYAGVGIAMLLGVLILSQVTYGAKITFTIATAIGQVTFQPSEFVKPLFVFFLAGALWEKTSLGRVAVTAALAGVHVIILVLSRDLGSAVIFFVGYVFMVFLASGNYLYLLLGLAGGSGAACVAYRLFAHVRSRVLAWRDPWGYLDNLGYSVTQSLFAIGTGSWFGMGLLQGSPDDIPNVMEDFVFSSVCEELGALFGICILLLEVNLFLTMLGIAARIKDRFYQLVVYGIGILYIFQVFLTIGGGIKFIPLTGVTLPFISYGGSSVMTTMIMFFIIQGIYIRLRQQEGGKSGGREKKEDAPQG